KHPTQIYEALAYLFIFIGLYSFYNKKGQKIVNGTFFGWFLILLFTARFFIEFIKEDQSAFEAGMLLNMGQILSIPFVFAGIGLLIYTNRKKKKSDNSGKD
ncbi:MAG: prolipoprotein diacylglyceryl transferase family protein, partial [Bacteroidota bacterium]